MRERLATYERELRRVGEERGERESFITAQLADLSQHEEGSASWKPKCRRRRAVWKSLRQRVMKLRSWPQKFARNVATLEERRRGAMLAVQRIEAMLSEVSAHLAS